MSPAQRRRQRTALYRFFDAEGRLLYVGIAVDFEVRREQHQKKAKWWPDQVRYEVEWLPDRASALAAELRAIQTEGPLHNVRGTGRAGERAPKQYAGGTQMSTVEVARELGVSVATINEWERSGTLAPVCRLPFSNHRRYSRADVEMLKRELAA